MYHFGWRACFITVSLERDKPNLAKNLGFDHLYLYGMRYDELLKKKLLLFSFLVDAKSLIS